MSRRESIWAVLNGLLWLGFAGLGALAVGIYWFDWGRFTDVLRVSLPLLCALLIFYFLVRVSHVHIWRANERWVRAQQPSAFVFFSSSYAGHFMKVFRTDADRLVPQDLHEVPLVGRRNIVAFDRDGLSIYSSGFPRRRMDLISWERVESVTSGVSYLGQAISGSTVDVHVRNRLATAVLVLGPLHTDVLRSGFPILNAKSVAAIAQKAESMRPGSVRLGTSGR